MLYHCATSLRWMVRSPHLGHRAPVACFATLNAAGIVQKEQSLFVSHLTHTWEARNIRPSRSHRTQLSFDRVRPQRRRASGRAHSHRSLPSVPPATLRRLSPPPGAETLSVKKEGALDPLKTITNWARRFAAYRAATSPVASNL